MIKIELHNNPGYPTTRPEYYGTIHHMRNGVAAGVNCDYKSTLPVRRYLCGLEPPNYPVPVPIAIAEYDLEYLWMLHERASLIQELRNIRGDTNH